MVSTTVQLRNIAGTQAALGWAGAHTVVVDRPEGVANGLGLGFNGAQLLALAIGGCFCNDLRYVSDRMEKHLWSIAVTASIDLDGDPPIATAATLTVSCETIDGSDPQPIIDEAMAITMVSRSLRRGFPVEIRVFDKSSRS
jgi:organic hydroperoxide reductase OsmC/OhrA